MTSTPNHLQKENEALRAEIERLKWELSDSVIKPLTFKHKLPSDILEKLGKVKQALNSFQVWFSHLPEQKTLFTEGKNKSQDELLDVFHKLHTALQLLEEVVG